MKPRVDKNKFYLMLVYLCLVFVFLHLLPVEKVFRFYNGLIIILIVLLVISYESLLRAIQHATGYFSGSNEHSFFSAFIDLNQKIHNFLQVDDVLISVDDTLKKKIKAKKVVFLLAEEFKTPVREKPAEGQTEKKCMNQLRLWPGMGLEYDFLQDNFSSEVLKLGKVLAASNGNSILQKAFLQTATTLAIPIIQDQRVLCVILIGHSGSHTTYSDFEIQMFTFLANQLSIVLDRIRVYEQIMQKTAMDHKEKVQVMQSLSANIAHEMRTPLSGIRASMSGIESYLPDLLRAYEYSSKNFSEEFPTIRESHMTTLQSTLERISLMIDQANSVIDMLLMNLRDNSFDVKQLSVCSARSCIEQAVDRYPFKTGEHEKVSLKLDDEFTFLGIETLFIYVIFNLLKNALYSIRSARKGEIIIRTEKGEEVNYVYFRDTGEGIDEATIDSIFDGFFTTKSDGTGAGLTYCMRTLMSFGGRIECESKPGEYAEFKISLPV